MPGNGFTRFWYILLHGKFRKIVAFQFFLLIIFKEECDEFFLGKGTAVRIKGYLAMAALLSGLLAPGAELVWNYSGTESMPKEQNGAFARLSDVKTPDGQNALRVWAKYDSEELKYQPVITFMAPAGVLENAETVEISFYCRADFDGTLELRSTPRSNTAFHLTDTVPVKFGTRWERLTCTLKVRPARGGEPVIQLPRILLSTVKANQMIYFGPITVTVPAGKEGAE